MIDMGVCSFLQFLCCYMVRPVMRILPMPTIMGETKINNTANRMIATIQRQAGFRWFFRSMARTETQVTATAMPIVNNQRNGRCAIDAPGSARAVNGEHSNTLVMNAAPDCKDFATRVRFAVYGETCCLSGKAAYLMMNTLNTRRPDITVSSNTN